MTEIKTKKELETALYSAADALRGKMDANEYKNYLLGIVFYKYLSDKLLYHVGEVLESDPKLPLQHNQKLYEREYDTNLDLQDEIKNSLSFILEPKHTFTYILNEINGEARDDKGIKTFQISDLADAFNDIESTSHDFEGLFQDVQLYSPRLGANAQKQADTIANVIKAIGGLEIVHAPGDILGDAYEYLIGQFASETGKKAGEFYTPQKVSELLTKLTLVDKNYPGGMTVYDPAMGSGSLLLNFRKFIDEVNGKPDEVIYYGQEINMSTFNLAKMNMILHGVDASNQHLRNGDTLDEDWPPIFPVMFDAVVMIRHIHFIGLQIKGSYKIRDLVLMVY